MTFKTIQLPERSTKETRDYARAVKKGMNSYFVVQNGKDWYVRKASAQNSNGKLFPNKTEAVEYAKKLALKRDSEYLVFNREGELIERQTQ
jgi:hypothetical protein